MSDHEDKGFKVVDRRGMPDEEKEKETGKEKAEEKQQQEAPSPPHSSGDAGNRRAPAGVQGEKSPEQARSPVGGPTFLDLVMSLQMGAMVNLGMVQASDGRRSPVNLPAAKDSIDLLDILKEKTRGNLSEEESSVLTEGLYHLRMAYVEAVNAGVSAPTGGQGRGGKQT